MSRAEEYEALLSALRETPPGLEGTVARAKARRRAAKLGRYWGIPVATLGGIAAAFILLVNTSIPFARACGSIPLLKGLATAAAFSPSLKAAVEHDYVQPMGISQTDNGVTLTVEYLIADRKQVNIFYTITGDKSQTYFADPDVARLDGSPMPGVSSGGAPCAEDGALRKTTLDFKETDAPQSLRLTMTVRAEYKAPPIANFSMDLHLDPALIAEGKIYELNETVDLDGQQLTLQRVEIYPTHMRLFTLEPPENTALLSTLYFYVEDGAGKSAEKISNGISSTGSAQEGGMTHHLESTYFWDAEQLTLCITGATWLDKDRKTVHLDIQNGTSGPLPDDVTLGKLERVGKDVNVVLVAKIFEENRMYSVEGRNYYDPEGGSHSINETGSSYCHDKNGDKVTGYFEECFTLYDYPWDSAELEVNFTRRTLLEAPLRVEIK
ncbi:MAG: DUF4179 domain-containing protein [Pseudoflavonifractor sp.]